MICFPFPFKRKSFQYEREVRIILMVQTLKNIKWWFKINVDISQLIEKYTFTPNLKIGTKNLVIALVEKLGFGFTIEKSDLESDILI
jgi:hypothetical protein